MRKLDIIGKETGNFRQNLGTLKMNQTGIVELKNTISAIKNPLGKTKNRLG